MVVLRAMATASTDAHTEVAPLTPQSQGVSAGRVRARPQAERERHPHEQPGDGQQRGRDGDADRRRRAFEPVGQQRRQHAEDDQQARAGRPAGPARPGRSPPGAMRLVSALPMPLESSSENSTTVRP